MEDNFELSGMIDHTILKPNCSAEEVKVLCQEAIENSFAAVCVPPYFASDAARILEDHQVKVATVIGFPMGYSSTPAKVEEVKRAIDDGVDELDVVINICAVKNGNWAYVKNDINSVTTATHLKGKVVKVILETGMLDESELEKLCTICLEIGVDYVKTSTGYNGKGATIKAVEFLQSKLQDKVKIKASGGIDNHKKATDLIKAGANRLGCSKSMKIIEA